jgi:MFS family permease
MWFAGGLAALSSITYPSISAFVSVYAKDNQQGLVQGMVNGVRGLCNGLGPALFGFIFYLFNVNLNESIPPTISTPSNHTLIRLNERPISASMLSRDVPGPPFLFGALLATIGLMFCLLLPNSKPDSSGLCVDTRIIEQKARLLDDDPDSNDNIST